MKKSYGRKPRRISKKRDPWYNKYLHFGKRLVAGASGGALGYIYGNLPGAYAGAGAAYDYVGRYRRPYRAKVMSGGFNKGYDYRRPVLVGSNPGHRLGSNMPPGWTKPKKYKGGVFWVSHRGRGHKFRKFKAKNVKNF